MPEDRRQNRVAALPARLIGKLRHEGFLAAKGLYQASRAPGRARVVLVPGVQRSGTNLVMNVLERSWRTAVFHERDPRAFDHYAMRPLPEIRALHGRCRAELFVLKALLESHRAGALLDAFDGVGGGSRGLWLVRDYRDMVSSHLVSWPGYGEDLDKILEDPSSAGFRGLGMTPETLDELRAHYRPEGGVASHVALFWWLRNRLLFDQGLERDRRLLVVRYEALVGDPAATLRAICDHVGLAYQARLHSMIHGRSVKKRAGPAISEPVAALCEAMQARLWRAADVGSRISDVKQQGVF